MRRQLQQSCQDVTNDSFRRNEKIRNVQRRISFRKTCVIGTTRTLPIYTIIYYRIEYNNTFEWRKKDLGPYFHWMDFQFSLYIVLVKMTTTTMMSLVLSVVATMSFSCAWHATGRKKNCFLYLFIFFIPLLTTVATTYTYAHHE